MTNEEKAIEICCEPIRCEHNCQWCSMSAAKNDCLQMAEWKDEQHKQEKQQWKRLMAESKSIGADLLQRKEEQYKAEKQQWIEKACKWFKNHAEDFIDDEGGTIMPYIEDECFVRLKKAMEDEL